MAGYCLAGSVRDHAFFFLWGTGANGKSVFTTVMMDILGDYATAAAPGTFTASNYQQHPTELAMLRGARLVVASEIERGARIAESRLKLMTGGDRLMARHMRQDFWNFEPTFKIMMTGNQFPNLGGVDEAIQTGFVRHSATRKVVAKSIGWRLFVEYVYAYRKPTSYRATKRRVPEEPGL